jgi:5-methylcytosine-specific restriction endonuclease McrA
MMALDCVICGQPLPPQKPGARRKSCPGACTKERTRRTSRAAYEARRDDPAQQEKLRGQRARAFKKWRESHPEYNAKRLQDWRDQNGARMADSNREYRQANPDKVRAKNLRRRARLMNAFVEDVDLGELWTRDAGICGICSEPVEADLAWPDKFSKTLDHVIPLSRGGEHSWANAQLAHAVCNSRKSNFIDH